ncbi:multidrug ABC transporter permease [Hwanghaeella grinnelliae]|uniref:Transport permease protein n=1 Tax=Hwanghaeella grinnelliae TaxID=2500179 RepID=A0A437QPJ1_9PROT|nr:ABC transporter permease [Hwanghaeella grinnelliae]RVU36404.1 multidrug ABC transporter permease [Hwanghaeella grinnelliae]
MDSRQTIGVSLTPKRFGTVNWYGLWSLYKKEVHRFLKVFTQTVAAPMVTALLFLAIFTLALGRAVETIGGIPFSQFLAPGLITMAMAQNAFANTSSSVVSAKMQGNIVDVIMPPISPTEFVIAYVMGGVTRGMFVGLTTWIGMSFFVPMEVHSLLHLVYHATTASMMLALLGLIGGIWADKFDHVAAITNFVVTPFAFLSGTFYSISRLPEPFYTLAHYNPFFYMIDGFRYGAIGVSDTAPWIGMAVMAGVNAALGLLAWRMVSTGYKLKA